MASSSILFCSLVLLLLLFSTTPSLAKTTFKPKALVLPVSKDASTLQYLTSIKQRTPLATTRLILDLGGEYLWVNCDNDYVSSTYKPSVCGSAPCKLAKSISCFNCGAPKRPGCSNNTCYLTPSDTVTATYGKSRELGQDVVSLHSTDGTNPGKLVSIPNFLFGCGDPELLANPKLPKGVKGFAGLGTAKIGIPSQFASSFGFQNKFAICLPSSRKAYGVVIFGPGPYVFHSGGSDLSKSLVYTPLLLNPITTAPDYVQGKPSTEYFINVMAIKLSGHSLFLGSALSDIGKDGSGGTKISTVHPYTVLEYSIYNVFLLAYAKLLPAQISTVTPVAPFELCIDSTTADPSGVGAVPVIDFVLQSESVYWRMTAANSMVQVSKNVQCLGFVNAGFPKGPRAASIVIGAHQLQDNLLQFDLANKRLGFSNSLLPKKLSCGSFNFTSTA